MGSLPWGYGKTSFSVFFVREPFKMADLALTQPPPPLSAYLSLEQHLNISGIRPVKLGLCQNKYLEIFIIMLLF